ncbi:unnamed protein product [Ixodes persulcatus]
MHSFHHQRQASYAGIYFHTGLQNRKHWFRCSQCTQTSKNLQIPNSMKLGEKVQASQPRIQSSSRNLVRIPFESQSHAQLPVVFLENYLNLHAPLHALSKCRAIKTLHLEYKNITAFAGTVQNSLQCSGLQMMHEAFKGGTAS